MYQCEYFLCINVNLYHINSMWIYMNVNRICINVNILCINVNIFYVSIRTTENYQFHKFKHEHKRINPTGPIKRMTHNQCHQSCKVESRTQDHSHTKLGTFRSTTKVWLLIWQSLAFYSNRVMAADLAYSHFLWAGTFIMFFQMKFKFSKKFKQFMILYKICFF